MDKDPFLRSNGSLSIFQINIEPTPLAYMDKDPFYLNQRIPITGINNVIQNVIHPITNQYDSSLK